MWISDTSIRRPVTTLTVMGAIVIFGWIGYSSMGIDSFPEVDFPTVTVLTVLPGASPEVMDQDVTDVIEEEVKTLAGIKKLTSQSFEGVSRVVVEFNLDKDIDVAAEEVRAKVGVVRRTLPQDIEEPIVEKFDIAAFPFMWVAFSSTGDYGDLSFYTDKVAKEQLQSVPGVGAIMMGGLREREIRVWLDPERLQARGLTAMDVVRAIGAKHVELPGGRVEMPDREFSVKVEGEYATVAELEDLVVASRRGALVTLRDVGRVEDGFQDLRTVARYNGIPTIGLGIRKQTGANTVRVAEAVEAKLQEMQRTAPEGTRIDIAFNAADFIRGSMSGVQVDILFGILLTAAIMFLFLRNVRTTFITVIAIPISLVGGFIVMNALGFTVNNMTMLAMSLAVGLVIDDAIVVLENIFRHVEGGEGVRDAARRGTSEVGFAVIAATSSIAAVFIPVAFMEGMIGRFFYQFGLTVALTIVISMIVSLTFTPFLSSRLLRHEAGHGRLYTTLENGFRAMEETYRRTLGWAVRHRWTMVGLTTAAFLAGVSLVFFVGGEFMTQADEGNFMVTFELPTGTSLERSDLRLRELEKDLFSTPEVAGAFTALGLDDGGNEINKGMMFVRLVPKAERERSQAQVMQSLREAFGKHDDMVVQLVTWNMFGGSGRNTDITYVLQGPSLQELGTVAAKITDEMRRDGRFIDIDTDLRLTKPDVKVAINRGLANDLGVDVRAISEEIYALFGGVDAAKFKEGGYRYDIRVRALPQYRAQPADLDRIAVRSASGELVKAPNLVDYEVGLGPNVINRFDRRRAVTLYANVKGIPAGDALRVVEGMVARAMPDDGRWRGAPSGTSQEFIDAMRNMTLALALSILIIYMILAVQFESFLHPFTIMFSLPLTMVGVFGALLATGHTLNVFSFIGIIMLMGIVTKNAILLVDFANQRRAAGADKVQAMLEAGPVRLRPILMTAASTIIGVVPVALALSEGGESRAPMAVAVIGGALTSTLLTLIVIPVIYLMLDDGAAWVGARLGRRAPAPGSAPVPAPAPSREALQP